MNHNLLPLSFFARPVLTVAPELLGNYLVRKLNDQEIALCITEVEAYDGPLDLACHGRFGRTTRTEPMFGPAGYFYVYLVYGMYWMLNVVTDEPGYPAAILIRGTEHISGPGKVTKHLSIDKTFNNKIVHPASELWIEDRGMSSYTHTIVTTPRIGISYAGPIWSQKPYRFVLK